ncbi:class I adenylate cyclase [Halopseudomonas salegens]|uniref:Adenylate cyclase n=1 Tax=Halopseudomonas salegens TaxID=1434072 RepID=A0A1H2HXA5_9GAMM|nr:class I adenylate cyclase [Halopseudomonas salegens]SDU36520.1 adenylate cyclase [Halopseudomonas salegens]
MPASGEIRLELQEGIDRKTLTTLRKRFSQLNQTRLRRVTQALGSRQYLVLQLIPLLFDVNHPLLPGYIAGHTPRGLATYLPDNETLLAAQSLTRSFSWRKHPAGFNPQIHALYLMGSGGTIAQSDKSDLDIWVCHDPALNEAERLELASKCQLITDWADTLNCEAHFHLIDPARFSRGERDNDLTTEDCGSSQHYLLLDEFYRTAILLAGRYPLWWMVPVYEEHNYPEYTKALLGKRFLRARDALDLGHLAEIPAGEYVGAGLWQLFKGIDSPYKSVLKLLLTEVYANQHPDVECLSLSFKREVYAGEPDADELDPYIMLYRKVEAYLKARGDLDRLDLVRRCLYLKADVRLSRRGGMLDWKRQLMEKLVREWQWDTRQLQQLDNRRQWRVEEVSRERRQLVSELTHSYRLLSHFGRSHNVINAINNRDMSLLGRRLHAAFERKAGKVEVINPGIAPDLAEPLLTLAAEQRDGQASWALLRGSLNLTEIDAHKPLKRTRHVMELLTWGYRNGVIDAASRFALHPGDSALSEFELNNLLTSLRQSFPLPMPVLTEAALSRASQPCQVLLLVNVGLDPLPASSQKNLHLISSHTDALGYSGLRDNLILSIDQITLNSWNEILVSRYDGEQACIQALCDFLNQGQAHQRLPELQVACYCRNRSSAIAERVESLFRDAAERLLAEPAQQFLLQVQTGFRLLERRNGAIEVTALDDQEALQRHLGRSKPRHTALHLDNYALQGQDLALVLRQDQPGRTQVFFRLLGNQQAELYVLDERGSLWRQRTAYQDEQTLLLPLLRFLYSVRLRRQINQPLDAQRNQDELQIGEILPAGANHPTRVVPRKVPELKLEADFYAVQAIAEPSDQHSSWVVSIFCEHREFSALEHGDQLFSAVARHILERRREHSRYPCYITDLDLSAADPAGKMQTVHYLRYRQQLEQSLNQAMDSLRQ